MFPLFFQVVHEGSVKRTKFFENGKKSRKNWMECYMVLTQTGLYFYKDHRTYTATVSIDKSIISRKSF